MNLRPYQIKAIDDARELLRAGKKRVLVVCPTGGGKTVVASDIIRSAEAKKSRVVFLAHRRELIQQTCDKLNRFGVRHGVIMAGIRPAPQMLVQVASIQSLLSRPGALVGADLIFADEAHHLTLRNSYAKILSWFPGARLVGLTATPWRLDGHGLGDVFDGHVVASTPRELRDLGYLVPVGGWEYEAIDTTSARVKLGDFVVGDLQQSATSAKVVGDVVAEWKEHAEGRRTVLFALSIEHSKHMVRAFRDAGVAAEHIDGEMPTAERDAVLRRLRSGQTLVVCNCNVLTEGFDCPSLEVCILARPTLSTSLFLQMVGRVLRPVCLDCGAPTAASAERCGCGSTNIKRLARIHDHAGCLAAHGHPFAARDYSPEVSSKGDRKSATEGVPLEKRCPSCKCVVSDWPCDACRYVPTKEELQLEPVPAAAKREITNDGSGPSRKVDDDFTRARTWAREFAHDEERKRAFFRKMVIRHGLEKARRVYWWFSGKVAFAPLGWVAEERERLGAEFLAVGGGS